MDDRDSTRPEAGIALLDTVHRATATDSVLQSITEAIIEGKIRPGDPLIESQIAEQMGVSRGPVREALAQLEHMGLVEKIPYKGAFVSRLSEEGIRELYTLRSLLEGLAARLITESKDAEAAARLEAILEQMQKVAEEGDLTALVDLDLQFHDNLCSLSGHKLLVQVWTTHFQMRLKRFLLLKEERLYADLMEAVVLHRRIVEAIRGGDPQAAERTAAQHVIEAGEWMLRIPLKKVWENPFVDPL